MSSFFTNGNKTISAIKIRLGAAFAYLSRGKIKQKNKNKYG